jgi:hypothetical protein
MTVATNTRVLLLTLATLPVLGASICEPDPCEGLAGPFSAVVGTGSSTLVPLTDGDVVLYVRGIQGGTHVEGAVQVDNIFFPTDELAAVELLPTMSFTLHNDADVLVGGYEGQPRSFTATTDGGGTGVRLGEQVIFFEDASAFVGQTLRLSAEVTDICGHTVGDEHLITIGDPGGGPTG